MFLNRKVDIYKDDKIADNINSYCIWEVSFNIFYSDLEHHKHLQRIFQKDELVFYCQNPTIPSLTATFSFGFLSCMYCSSLVTKMLDIENLKIKTMSQDFLWNNFLCIFAHTKSCNAYTLLGWLLWKSMWQLIKPLNCLLQ